MINFQPTWNPIGIYQVLTFVFLCGDETRILLKKKNFDGNSLAMVFVAGPTFSCAVAALCGYWHFQDLDFSSVFFLTLSSAVFQVLTFLTIHLVRPNPNDAITGLQNQPEKYRFKFFFWCVVYYIAGGFALWFGYRSGYLSAFHPCGTSLICQSGQIVVGSIGSAFPYITLFALLFQSSLAIAALILLSLIIPPRASEKTRSANS